MNDDLNLPGDFTPVDIRIPEWVDIPGVCGDSPRFVGLYCVNGFEVIAINNGRSIFTTHDRGGEFRRRVDSLLGVHPTEPQRHRPDHDTVLIYDCEDSRQWIAPRASAVQFLYRQN